MGDTITEMIKECDLLKHNVLTHQAMAPSSSVEEISEHIANKISEYVKERLLEVLDSIQDRGVKLISGRSEISVTEIPNQQIAGCIIRKLNK